ncbi:MAG: cofactor-independent phosphoglycerate mutase [Clostridia bacterium]|nr:cofactor-independent phosphoglycerate mutase [Clostridia bacterium]
MKYLILVYDGMADRKIEELGGRTPMEAAHKPTMDKLAQVSECGTVSNVPQGMVPESDTANLAILSYDPREYSKGRSPLEAVSMGIDMKSDETAYRCNLVAVSDEGEYEQKIMLDHSADEITTAEADLLIQALNEKLANEERTLYTGISYRHCLIWKNGNDKFPFARPHDIIGKKIEKYLPQGEEGEVFYRFMRESHDILNHHPVNEARRARGLLPANSAWLWSPGKKPSLPSFKEKWGLDASVISAVDLIKGIGLCAKMESVDVEGATGNIHTNFKGKADAAIDAFRRGKDLVYVHVEAPDECGHRAEIENKVLSIEKIDAEILTPVLAYLESTGEDFRIACLPDHPTPVAIRTHSMEPVPFMIYRSDRKEKGVSTLTEDTAEACQNYLPDGTVLMEKVIRG